MKQYGTQRSTVKPEDVEITESKVFTYENDQSRWVCNKFNICSEQHETS